MWKTLCRGLVLLLEIVEKQENIMAGQNELKAALDAAPQAIATQVIDAVKPLITAQEVDTQPSIDAINALPAAVVSAVNAALTPPAP